MAEWRGRWRTEAQFPGMEGRRTSVARRRKGKPSKYNRNILSCQVVTEKRALGRPSHSIPCCDPGWERVATGGHIPTWEEWENPVSDGTGKVGDTAQRDWVSCTLHSSSQHEDNLPYKRSKRQTQPHLTIHPDIFLKHNNNQRTQRYHSSDIKDQNTNILSQPLVLRERVRGNIFCFVSRKRNEKSQWLKTWQVLKINTP